MDYVIRTHDLTKTYGHKNVVDKVCMNVAKGDIYGFIGKNGAGKTTTMKMLLGMIFTNGGTMELFGKKADDSTRKRIGSLIEAPGLYNSCTAYENLKRFSILYGGTDKEIKDILEIVGLANTGKKKAGAFSLGMRQRLGIAISLLGSPEMLILDEPVNGLDPSAIKLVRDTILNINRERGVSFLISSHLLGELSKISTRYGIINNGVLVDELTAQELDARCGQSISIKCRDTAAAEKLLREKFGIVDIELGTEQLSFDGGYDRTEEMLAELVRAGVGVFDFHLSASDMENYFIERIGR